MNRDTWIDYLVGGACRERNLPPLASLIPGTESASSPSDVTLQVIELVEMTLVRLTYPPAVIERYVGWLQGGAVGGYDRKERKRVYGARKAVETGQWNGKKYPILLSDPIFLNELSILFSYNELLGGIPSGIDFEGGVV